MVRMRVALVHKIVPVSVLAVLLFCTPLQLTAQERAPRAADHQTSVIEWASSLWNDLAAWLTGDILPAPPDTEPSDSRTDNSCAIDPNGGCGS
jgi:hypothetical protein